MLEYAREAIALMRGKTRADLDTDRALGLATLRCLVAMLLVVARGTIGAEAAGPTDSSARVVFTDEDIQRYYVAHRGEVAVREKQIWVKAIILPSEEQAREVGRRALAKEDFDDLIAEYFVPYFAKHRKDKHITKEVDFGWVSPKGFWRGDKAAGPLAEFKPGQVSEPYPWCGRGTEFAVLRVEAERPAETAAVEAVSDNIYSRLWDTLADTRMLREVDAGRNEWCGTCRAGHHVNGQLWHLAQQYSADGDNRKAISACLLALREERALPSRGKPTSNDGLCPEEQFLVNQGMDLLRYYSGVFDRVQCGQPVALPDWLPGHVARMRRDAVIPMLIRLVESRSCWSESAMYALGTMKAQEAIPVLRKCLEDRQLRIVELGWGNKEAVYAQYVLREAARNALAQMGIVSGDVKIIVGTVQGDDLPSGWR